LPVEIYQSPPQFIRPAKTFKHITPQASDFLFAPARILAAAKIDEY